MTSTAQTEQLLGRQRACGKLILLGEHFVVHGAPAIALPLCSLQTEVTVQLSPPGPARLRSTAQGATVDLAEKLFALALSRLGLTAANCPWLVQARSTIPIGEGLGSSAAYAVALLRALAQAAGLALAPDALREHAHALEQVVHGDPSGIDDTTIASERPVWFIRGEPPELLEQLPQLGLVLASSGRPRSTAQAVRQVRERKEAAPDRFAQLLAEATRLAEQGRRALAANAPAQLGPLLTRNHQLLKELGVSCTQLDTLVERALAAGALGAKLTGAGCGGFIVALAEPQHAAAIARALRQAGSPLVLGDQKGGA